MSAHTTHTLASGFTLTLIERPAVVYLGGGNPHTLNRPACWQVVERTPDGQFVAMNEYRTREQAELLIASVVASEAARPEFVPAPTFAVPGEPAWKAPGWRPTDEQLQRAHLLAIREEIGFGAALDRVLAEPLRHTGHTD